MKKRIRLTESDLHKIVNESVKNILNEYYATDSYGGQLTAGELIAELQKCDKDARVEIYVGNDTFHCITNVVGNYLFKSDREYAEWEKREREAAEEPEDPETDFKFLRKYGA